MRLVCQVLLRVMFISLAGSPALAGEHPKWGYAGDLGPDHWATLSEHYAPCGEGKLQSPVDLVIKPNTFQKCIPGIITQYKDNVGAVFEDTGHSLMVRFKDGGGLESNKEENRLLQLHFHHRSEHTIDGKSFPMEAHLVHLRGNLLTVIGILLEEGEQSNPLIDLLWRHLPEKGKMVSLPAEGVKASHLLPKKSAAFVYPGSLTTPDCREGVVWFVLQQPMTVTPEQIAAFASRYPANNRPVQLLYERTIKLGNVFK